MYEIYYWKFMTGIRVNFRFLNDEVTTISLDYAHICKFLYFYNIFQQLSAVSSILDRIRRFLQLPMSIFVSNFHTKCMEVNRLY